MIQAGTKLFDYQGREVEVMEIEAGDLHCRLKIVSTVSWDNGMQSEEQIHFTQKTYTREEIGITLFFDPKDSGIPRDQLVSREPYRLNELNIIRFHKQQRKKILEELRKNAPLVPMSTAEKELILMSYKSKNHAMKEEDAFNRMHSDQQYFGRMDFDTTYYKRGYEHLFKRHYYDKFYIGERDFEKDGRYLIVDWRKPIAGLFYESDKTNSTFGDIYKYEYDLMLKRQFNFKNGKRFYKDVFVAGDELYDLGNMDPFLLDVIAENRLKHEVTDIIKSIQANQNRIIRHNHQNHLLVQGCAGSGKTMILLHRLSYLMYNRHILSMGRVRVLTPNDIFNSAIRRLVQKLELGSLKLTGFENYAAELAERYQADLSRSASISPGSDLGARKGKAVAEKAERRLALWKAKRVADEDLLDKETIRTFYAKYKDEAKKIYRTKMQSVLDLIENSGIRDALEKEDGGQSQNGKVYLDKAFDSCRGILSRQDMLETDRYEAVKACGALLSERAGLVVECFQEAKATMRELFPGLLSSELLYRHEWTLLVYLYFLHCGELKQTEEHIFIDEVQDYSIQEIELLKKVNGDKTVFNLFGDINQVLNEARCVRGWIMMEEMFGVKRYELNENYRNTVQITEFCNERFGYDHSPIGLDGNEIQTIDVDKAVNQIREAYKNNDRNRIAVIYKTGKEDRFSELQQKLGEDFDQIFWGSVKDVKGLEFDYVFVLEEKMVNNERYVAYTRALDNLHIVV